MREYDVTWSLGDGLRPGSIADASDEAQFAELEVLGELTERGWANGTQVMVEGPGHIPMDQIDMNIEKQIEICDGAPFYVLGPLVTDIAPGYDHITSCHRRRPRRLARRGDALLRHAQGAPRPARKRGRQARRDRLQDRRPRRRRRPQAPRARKTATTPSAAPASPSTGTSSSASRSTPKRPRPITTKRCPQDTFKSAHFCSMCGPKYCSMKITEEIRAMAAENPLELPVVAKA